MHGKIAVDRSLREQMYSDKKQSEMKTVQEICKLTGVTRKTLYYYDKINLLKPVCRTGKQRSKRYSDEAVEILKQIKRYQEAGLTLTEIKCLRNTKVSEERVQILKSACRRLYSQNHKIEEEIKLLNSIILHETEVMNKNNQEG
ncbi:MAG: MerR family transcriptional regulator [Solobacterium sp.]|nr:MerR family transcriptional regulator [Solobacterium sp.]